MVQKVLGILLILVSLATAFSNCGGFEASKLAVQKQFSSACTTQLRTKAVSLGFAASICDDPANFACDARVFRPGVRDGKQEEKGCARTERGEVCVPLQVYSFNTESARAGALSEAYVEGGEYNRTEVQCYNTKVTSNQVTLIQADADSIEVALPQAIQRCRERSQQ